MLVTGGTSLGDRADPAGAVNVAELWNPGSGQWTTLASSAPRLRGYHSTSLLLPDGRVLHTGGGDGSGTPDNYNYEAVLAALPLQGRAPGHHRAAPERGRVRADAVSWTRRTPPASRR